MLSLSWLRTVLLTLGFALHIVGYLWFLKGFFPAKFVRSGFLEFQQNTSPYAVNGRAQFDNLVLIVVDAMRSDFMYDKDVSHMSFLHKLISDGVALPFTAYSSPPTVTLPRLKGITSGTTPSFLDAILNIADDNDDSQGMTDVDSWVGQLKRGGKKLRFYGDDTWLKLFPPETYFDRYEGTNSFFVSDFFDVDNNVTRHLDFELENIKMNDVLILHYLGLDHIGHKGGPHSPFMADKQKEMDVIIQRVYEKISASNSLLVVMGDHGMNEIGNHGGSSSGETSPGMLFASPKFKSLDLKLDSPVSGVSDFKYYQTISQVDLVPTLASLLCFPIPKNSIGVMIEEFLGLWKPQQRTQILKHNLMQLQTLQGDEAPFETVSESEPDLYQALRTILSRLQSAATDYKYGDIFSGILCLITGAVISLLLYASFWSQSFKPMAVHYLIIMLYAVHFHASSLVEEEHQIWWLACISALIIYSYNDGFRSMVSHAVALTCIRMIKAWSNSGQKYSQMTFGEILFNNTTILWFLVAITYAILAVKIFAQGNFIDCFTLTEQPTMTTKVKDLGTLAVFILIFVTCSVSFLFKLCQYATDGRKIPYWLTGLFSWICESYGINQETADKHDLQQLNTNLSKSTMWLIIVLLSTRVILGKVRHFRSGTLTDVSNILTVGLLHQTRIEVIPIFLVFFTLKFIMATTVVKRETKGRDLRMRTYFVTISCLCVQQLSFFSTGGTNLLATVDLSNAYNGIESYQVIPVGLLTFVSNFSGPIFWAVSSFELLFDLRSASYQGTQTKDYDAGMLLRKESLLLKAATQLLFYSLSSVILVTACVNLRFHLFIWSVFSPKLLFFGVWTLFMNIFVELMMSMLTLII